tara:strand:- start:106 stop:687 length:582 start_codon:yes stop_codon:yes gene_type:complete
MSKKKLLEEAQVRRMFQLAGIPAIGESFIGDKFSRFVEEEEKEEEKDEVEEGKYSREDEDDKKEVEESFAALGEEDEDPMGDEPAEDPMGDEPAEDPMGDAPEAGGDIPQDKVEAIVDAVLAGIEKETGVPLERVPDAEGGEEPEAGGEEEIAAAGGEEEEPVEDALAMEREMVNEVARRVARKLLKMSKKGN